ncbi:hypothetical protein [Paenibacillus glucanolyticus]|jgi:hypothetical protein|uniref:hypothetical protein n=1 Tax=Paenibacillus glucanolyticus TaxID=59843 RepID=UPI00128C9484|nr:hypothetical protein [Paenibacillus glucanolyticus]MPY20056.1 hypothetical protein [Paenibacillus glucanolyticus]
MIYKNEKQLIDVEFPMEVRSQIVSSVFMGYELVTKLVKEHLWLQSVYGKNAYGDLRNAAVSFCIDHKISENKLPIVSKSATNSRNNYNYIQILTNNSLINVSQVMHPNAVPPYADFRFENSFMNGQLEFFDNDGTIEIDNKVELSNSRYYMLLTHGCTMNLPSFIHIGIPEVGAKKWRYQYNLLRDPQLIHQSDKEEIEVVLPKFKERVLKGVQGDGQKF